MQGWPRDLGLNGEPAPLDELRVAVERERVAGRRATPVRVVSVDAVDGEDGTLWELEVEADGPLPEAREWAGADVARTLDAPDGGGGTWSAQVLDVDPIGRRLFVEGSGLTTGRATVWPFDYLAALGLLAHDPRLAGLLPDLARLLTAARGEARPARRPAPDCDPAWGWSWSLVWGPPGTGKTWTLGRQVAALLQDPRERVLVVSTTNRAADAAALQLGEALLEAGAPLEGVVRAGRVVRAAAYTERGLRALLPAPEAAEALERAEEGWVGATVPADRARARQEQAEVRKRVPGLRRFALDDGVRCAVSTLYGAIDLLRVEGVRAVLDAGRAPFTTVVVDEAGLVGRAQVAAVALHAARRVVLVGDPRQLSPIARASRSLPREVVRWLSRSGLDHLRADALGPNVLALTEQRRMHPAIGEAVSALQYEGRLRHHPDTARRAWVGTRPLRHLPRVVWVVLDEHPGLGVDGAASRPGPGGRSRLREATAAVLTALAQAEPTLAELPGLFITPYAAQAAAAAGWLRAAGLARFRTSTVHAQQGAEADVVVFDTVHASSTGWPPDEWVRLVNVGLSRARELVILLATRDEVSQPWMRPLRPHLAPRALHRHGEGWAWREVDGVQRAQSSLFGAPVAAAPEAPPLPEGEGMGAQIARRRALRPILSRDQRRLVDRDLADAGPRLVRGVAGSGKTLVLAHWVVRTLMGQGFERVVILYGNRALDKLLRAMLDEAWVARQEGVPRAVPWERIRLLHVADLLADLRLERGLPPPADRYDYEAQAAAILADGPVAPRFEALFVDEAQDLGHDALRLAVDLVRPHHGRKPVLVFYDNAQNVYGRRAPVWAELGLDMRGRSDVMEEGFRNGRQIVEAALNLVHRLTGDLLRDPDLRELHRRGLIAASQRRWEPWWEARFCPDDGEEPAVYVFEDEAAERAFVARRVRELIDEGVRPGDLRVVCLSADQRRAVVEALRAAVPEVAVREVRQEGFVGLDDVIAVTTPHSIKGYDAEVVLVLGADRFVARGEALVSTLYVAMTRARTLLVLTAVRREGQPEEGLRIAEAVAELRDLLAYRVESDRFERPL